MTVSLFTFVDLYARVLNSAEHLLAKGAEHAVAQGGSEDDVLAWRLIDDMHPLAFQAMVLCNFPRQWTARVAGLEVPASVDADLTLAGYRAEIAKAQSYLAALTIEQFAGRDDLPLTVTIMPGMEPTMPAGQWLTVFATTNIYFHLSALYAILRAKGVQIGKIDLFAGKL